MDKFIRLPDKESLTVREVANAMGMHVSSIWRYMLKGVNGRRLSWFLLGARRRVRRVDIEAWLEAVNGDRHNATQESHRDQRARQDRSAQFVERQLDAEGF